MKKVTEKAKIHLNVKLGVVSKNDIYFCEKLNITGIVAPMVESPYALREFPELFQKNKQNLYVNLESIQAFKNVKK